MEVEVDIEVVAWEVVYSRETKISRYNGTTFTSSCPTLAITTTSSGNIYRSSAIGIVAAISWA